MGGSEELRDLSSRRNGTTGNPFEHRTLGARLRSLGAATLAGLIIAAGPAGGAFALSSTSSSTSAPTTSSTAAPDALATTSTTSSTTPSTTSTTTPSTTTSTTTPATTSELGTSLLVRTVAGLSAADQAAAITSHGGTETGAIAALHMHVVDVPSGSADAAIAAYRADARVVSVSLDNVRSAETAGTDPAYGDQWALPQIGWDQIHGVVTPTSSATIAVLDTGVDASTPDLAGRTVAGWSYDGTDPATDSNGHGTHEATIAAGATDDGNGIAGVAYAGVKVMPVRVLDSTGLGNDSDIITGLVWAADHGADVALMAFSNPGSSPALQAAIDYAWSKGVIVVAAAGNDGTTSPMYPAGLSKVVGVGATDQSDNAATFSNRSDAVFIAAPGVGIDASDASGVSAENGTSASAAIVAGAAALLRANDPSASNATIVGRLARNTDATNDGSGGNGRLNFDRAIADTSTVGVTPAGVPGGGGPVVGPYKAAATITWDGSSSTAWNTASNWSSNTVPGSGDTVVIGNTNTANWPVLSSSTTVAALTLLGRTTTGATRGGSLTVNTGVTLTVSGNVQMTGSTGGTTGNAGVQLIANGTANVTIGGGVTMTASTGGPPEDPDITMGSGTLSIAGNFTNNSADGASSFTAGTSTLNLTGAAQTVSGSAPMTFNNVTTSGTNTKTFSNSETFNGTLTIGTGTTFSTGVSQTLKGNVANNGTFTASAGTVTMNGSAAQSITGTTPSFSGLTINNSNGVSFAGATGNSTVGGTLTLTSGALSTGSNRVIAGTVSRGSGFVNGNLQKNVTTGSPLLTYEVGTGTTYSPVSVAFSGVTTAGNLAVSATGSDHPNIATSGLDATHDVNRYWTLTPGGGLAGGTYAPVFAFVAGDIDAGSNTANFIVQRFASSAWNSTTTGTRTSTSTQATGIATGSFGDFAVGQVSSVVSGITPTTGPTTGGTPVTISGTGLTGATAVKFGTVNATNVVVVNDTTVTATSPATITVGSVDVTVTTPSGTTTTSANDLFTYTAVTPTVTSLNPTQGPSSSTTSVTITGTGFLTGSTVTFGAAAGTSVVVNSPTSITATAPAQSPGPVDVRVTTTGGTSVSNAGDVFTYVAAPTVTLVTPNAGPLGAGTAVTITGTNLTGATAVKFGSSSATSVVVVNDSTITANAPAGSAGTVDVTVTTVGGISATSANDHFTYTPAPTVTAVSPNQGPTAGGTSISITGTNFTAATAVSFGGNISSSFIVNSATSITATSPAGAAGTIDVRVTTVGGTSNAVTADHFTYVPAPTVSNISPTGGPTGGGTQVTITGTNLTGASAVNFGGTPALTYVVNSSTSITAYSPPGADGVGADVTVTAVGGTSGTGAGDVFTYDATALPTVTLVSPAQGTTLGGASVTITGTNFTTTGAAVSFGGTNATSFIVVSPTTITATAPVASPGLVHVTVTNSIGTSSTSASDTFTFVSPPTVTAVSPSNGVAAGGTTVTITGTDFTGATAVKFGATNAASFTVDDDNTIHATSPAGSANSTVDITVAGPGGVSATGTADRYTYVGNPTISSISPTAGPLAGGTTVAITGTNFSGISAVKFDTTAATSFTVVDTSHITAVSPAGSGGVHISVTNAASTVSSTQTFTYWDVPTVTGVSPAAGPLGGTTSVTITGTNFTGGSTVFFGSTQGSGAIISLNQITVTAPAHVGGTVDVTVTSAGGTSAISASDHYTYTAVVSSLTSSLGNGSYTVGQSIPVQVAFSSAVAVTGTPQLALTGGGVANYTSGSGTSTLTFTYVVGAGQNTSDLDEASTSALTLNSGTIVENVSGAAAILTLPAPQASGSLGLAKSIIIDTTAPTVTNVTSAVANDTYGNTYGPMAITVTFSENVTVTGTPTLALSSGGAASYASGSGTSTLTFNYTVAAPQSSSDLEATSLSGGTIRDAATNNAVSTLPAAGATGSLSLNKNIVIDTGAHTCTWTGGAGNSTWTNAANWSGCANVSPQPLDSVIIVTHSSLPTATTATVAAVEVQSGTLTIGANTLTVTGNFTVDSGATLSMTSSSGVLSIGGNLTDNGTVSYSSNTTPTITMTGASAQIGGTPANGVPFRNLTINPGATGTVTLASAIDMQSNSITGTTTLNVASGTLDLSTFAVNHSTGSTSRAFTLAANATLKVGGTSNFPSTSIFNGTFTVATGSTVDYDANAAQSVTARTYGYLKITGTGTKTLAASTGVMNDITIAAGATLDLTGGTLDLANTTPQSFNVNGTLIIENGALTNDTTPSPTYNLNAGATLRIGVGGSFPTGWGSAAGEITNIDPTSTVEYTGAAQSVVSPTTGASSPIAYGNLVLSGGNTKTATAALTVNGNLTIGSGTTFAAGTFSHAVKGNFTNGGTFTAGTSTFTFNGSSAQTISISGGATFNNVTVNNSSGVTISGGDMTVGGVLTLTNGVLSTATNKVNSTNSAANAVTGASANSFVAGNLVRAIPLGTNVARTFDVGSGTTYAPATVTFASVTTAGTLTASSTGSDHASMGITDLDPNRDANRYWTLTPAGGLLFTTYDVTVTYGSSDLDASANPNAFLMREINGATYSAPVSTSLGTNSVTGFGFNTFSDFVVGQLANVAPVAQPVTTQTNEDNATSVTLTGTDVDGNALTFSIVSGPTHGTLGTIDTPSCNGSTPSTCTASVTYTPDLNDNGPDSFTYKANDGSLDSGTGTVSITVSPVNDAPSFVKGADESVLEDAGAQTVNGWASAISAGPANESAQALTFDVSNDNNALFDAQPAIDASGNLTYTPAANANGTANVTVTLHDNGGTANGGVDASAAQTFVIDVTAVNDAPVAVDDPYTVNEDGSLTVDAAHGVLSNDADVDSQNLTAVQVLGTNHGLLSVAADGSFTYAPDANYFGTDTFTYHANDGSLDSADATVTITVNAVNDVPSFTKGADQSVLEDSGAQTVADWASAISAGPANESSQALTFNVSSDNSALFAAGPAVAADGTLTYTPAANANGNANVTISISDNGGVANGGVDTSADQHFVISVGAVNDAPTFTDASDQAVNEDSSAQTVPNWASAISAGPVDEAAQALTFNVINDNNALFSTQPAVAADGTLTYTPTFNMHGVAHVSVTLQDDGGIAYGGADTSVVHTFVIAVNAVNHAPSFTKGADQSVLEDSGAATVNGWATDISAGPADEAGQTVSFNVWNDNNALFSVQPSIAADGTLTYSPAGNANGSATVTVSLSDDGGIANGGHDTSADQTFVINVTAVNDAPSFTAGGGQTVNEDSGAATVTGWATDMSAGPADESSQALTFNVSNDNNTLFDVQPAVAADGTLTFTPAANANGSALVTVAVQDDGGIANGGADTSDAVQFLISVNPVNDVPSFTKGADQSVLEDSGAAIINGWATSVSAGPVNESSQVLTFNVSNDNNALFDVQPSVAADGTLTYTPAANANGSATVTVSLSDNGGTDLGGVDTSAAQTFVIDVTAVNDVPSFVAGADQTVSEDSGAATVTSWATGMSTGPANESSQSLSFNVSNDNNALFDVQPAIDAGGNLTYTPAANANGSALVTVTVQDDGGVANGGIDTSDAQQFMINVTPVNDVPSFAKGADQTVNEDSGAATVSGWATAISAGPADESSQVLTFNVSNDNNALFDVQPSIAADGTLTYTPAANANGSATVTVSLSDDGGTDLGGVDTSATQTFVIDVTAVNDAPSFVAGGDQTVNEDSGAATVNGWATAISAGPADEAAQTVGFNVSNDNNGLFDVQPAIDASGNLTYTPAANANGSALVTVTLSDNGGTDLGGVDTSDAQQFLITVNAVNDVPSFVKGADESVLEDAGAQTVNGWASDISAGPANENSQALSFNVSNDNNALFDVQPAIDASGNLTYTPAANANGSATVTVNVHDNGGTDFGGVDHSADQTFVIDVTPVNDAPSFVKGADEMVLEDSGAHTVNGWATDISAGPADEIAQLVSFDVSNDNHGLFDVQPAISPDGTLTYTLAATANGVAHVTVTLSDNGGTDFGGVDTSAPQTFVIDTAPVNHAPSFTKGADQSVLEDSGAATVNGWASDISAGPANESSQALTFNVSNDNNALFDVQPAIDASGNLTFTPAANANGSATVTVSLSDNGGTDNGGVDTSADQTFVIGVTAVNDVPSFVKGADQTVNEDSGAATVNGWATAISAGPADESSQALTFNVSNDNNSLFDVQPAIAADGTLTFTPAANANGSATVTVSLSDNGGTANGGVATSAERTFTITVNPVNDVPSFVAGTDTTVLEDSGAATVPNWASSISAGPVNESSQTVSFNVSNDNNALFDVQPAIDANGNLTYTPAANANGSALVTVSLSDDGGTDFGGVHTSDAQQFMINVTAVNDVPSFAKGADQTVNEDSGAATVNGWAATVSAGPANESSQALTFNVSNDNNDLFDVQPSIAADGTLTFTPAANANGSATVTVSLSDNGGTDNGGVGTTADQTFTITVNPVNDAPSFHAGTDQTVLEDSGAQTVSDWATALSTGPTDEAAQSLTFNVTNDNTGLFDVQPAIDASGNLTFTPAANANGSATVTVTLSDNGGTDLGGVDTSGVQQFVINVTPVNDVPSFVKGADQSVLEDSGAATVNGWATAISAGPADESSQALTFNVSNDNNGLFDVQPAIAADGTLTFTPAANANGSATVTVNLSDNGGTDNGGVDTTADQTFVINVTLVNDAPSFTKGADQGVLENASAQTVNGWATAISAGPADEAGQSVSFNVTNDNNGLFDVQPAIDATGNLTYTPAASANGVATVSVSLSDNGGTANGGVDTSAVQTFLINVGAVNDAPSFVKGADQTVLEDSGAATVSGWATSVSAGPADESSQVLTFHVSNDNNGLFDVQPAIAADGTLTFTPAANANGSATVTVSLSDDGGTANSGADTSADQTFMISVTPVNDAPSFTKGADESVNEDSGAHTVNGWATSISAGPADESGQSVTFNAANDNAALFDVAPAVDASGNLTYTLAANAFGTAHVTVSAIDDGGTAHGGVDTSAGQTLTITVNAVDDAPVAVNDSYQTNEDVALHVPATGVLGNDSDIDSPTLTASVVTNPAHGSVSLASDGSFVYSPDANYNGGDSFTYAASDGQIASNVATVTITVNAVNDAPSFTKGADQTVLEDSGAQTVSGWATSISTGPADEASQTVTFDLTNNNNALFSVQPSVAADGTLTYTPAANANGSATVTLLVRDNGGFADGGVNQSATQSFVIDVTPVNDTPSFTKGADQTVLEDSGAATVTNWATNMSAGPANESTQTLTFHASNDNNGLFSVQPAIAANGTLTYTPAANASGTANVTVTLSDNGGTANGGTDTSTSQSFVITVTPVNDAPTLSPIGNKTVTELSNLTFTASANDIDVPAQTLTYTMENGTTNCSAVTSCTVPAGASINPTTGVFSWTPTATQGPGTYRVYIAASDGIAESGEEITITVNDSTGSTNPKLVFTTAAQVMTIGVTSNTITVQRQSSTGTPLTAGSLTVSLTDTSATGVYRNTADTATITSVTIANGASSASFRFRDTTTGSPTLTASASAYTSATQVELVQRYKLVFTTVPRSTTTATATPTITVQRQFANGTPATANNLTVVLSDNSPTGAFRNTTDSATITSVSIPSGGSTASFRYRDTTVGTPTITVGASGFNGSSQTVTVTAAPRLVFTTPARVFSPGTVSDVITIQRQNPDGTPNTAGDLVVNLTDNTPYGMFRTTTNRTTITTATIRNGASTVSFIFYDSRLEAPTITVSAPGYLTASQREISDTAPTISSLATSLSVRRNQAVADNFIVDDADSGPYVVTVSATSSNQAVVANSGITFPDTSGYGRQIRVVGRSVGTTTITVTASDGVLTTVRTFTVTVTP